jgi:hypothetical protein
LASVIDLRNLSGNFEQQTFGRPFSPFEGQSVIANNVFLDEVRGRIHALTGNVLFNILITGDRPDSGDGFPSLGFAPDLADIRYNSGMLAATPAGGLTEFTVHPNIGVTNGERLFIVFDAFSYPASASGNIWATKQGAATDPYPAGELVYFNPLHGETTFADVNNNLWGHFGSFNEDLGILASFSMPEPTGCAMAGMFLAGAVLRRRSPRND